MPTTAKSIVVAVYKNNADAQGAAAELKANGFKDSDLFISSEETAASSGYAEVEQYRTSPREEGIKGWFKSLFHDHEEGDRGRYQNALEHGHVILSVETDDRDVAPVADILDRFNPIDIHREDAVETPPAATTANRNYALTSQGPAETPASEPARASAATAGEAIPVVAEELKIGKRQILRGGVRVYSRVVEQPVAENINLREEHVRVDREPVNRPVAGSGLQPGRDQVIEVQEFVEEPVVSKEARVVEEIRVRKEATERTETVRETVRRTEVRVEDLDSGLNDAYRRDFQTNYAASGGRYEDYEPAYRYGYEMANDPRYQNRNFGEIESDLRADYGRRYPDSTWERMKNAVRYGWDRVTGKTRTASSAR